MDRAPGTSRLLEPLPAASPSERARVAPAALGPATSGACVRLSVPQSVVSYGPPGSVRSRRSGFWRTPPAPLNRAPLSHSHFASCLAELVSRGVESHLPLAVLRKAGRNQGPSPFTRAGCKRVAGATVGACRPGSWSLCACTPRSKLERDPCYLPDSDPRVPGILVEAA